MDVFAGPLLACGVLLVVAGLPKLVRPTATVTALRSVGWRRAGPAPVRVFATVEIGVGVGLVVAGGPVWTVAAASIYLGFCAFLVIALRRPDASCGCTGRADTPPTVAHLVMNVLFVATAVAAGLTGTATGVGDVLSSAGVIEALVVVGYATVVAWFGWLVLAVLPTVR